MNYTLWQLLRERGIKIPVFQRDYAQGRLDKAALRRDLILQFVYALNGENNSDGRLDFVYSFSSGSKEMQPLDGQQRLTTLWLLHWYIAVRFLKGVDLSSALKTLSNFTYNTRHSSSGFISSMCKSEKVERLKKTSDIVEAICNSTWFVKAWLHDPTVMGMLNTLRGTKETNLLPNGIQSILEGYDDETLGSFWEKLTSVNCPITFDHLTIEDIDVKSPDLLYVKMNARGKSLTAYEKFKAQWIKEIKTLDSDKSFEMSKLIDNQWSDYFWDKNLKAIGLDERKMAFFTRFFLYRLMKVLVGSEKKSKLTKELQEKILGDSALYVREVKKGCYSFEFTGIDEFKIPISETETITLLTLSAFDELSIIFERLKLFSDVLSPKYFQDFSFIPALIGKKDNYEKDENGNWQVKKLSMKEQALFFAICLYFVESHNPNEITLHRWLRVCSNLIENTNQNSNRQTQLNIIEWIVKLGTNKFPPINQSTSHNPTIGCDEILECLKSFSFGRTNEIEKVLWEEREKATRILAIGESAEKKIEEAENFAFFNGAISFLFLNGNGEISWENFNQKFAKAKEIFRLEGLSEKASENDIANRILISCSTNWMSQIQRDVKILSHKSSTWRGILLDSNYITPIHQFLLDYRLINDNPLVDSDCYRDRAHKCLVEGGYLSSINEVERDKYYVRWCDSGMCLFVPYRTGDTYFMASERIEIFEILSKVFDAVTKVTNDKLYSRSFNFDIKYRNYVFRLQHWGWTDMYADGKKLQDIESLAGKCTISTSSIDPRKAEADVDSIKKEFDKCIKNYEDWMSIQNTTGSEENN